MSGGLEPCCMCNERGALLNGDVCPQCDGFGEFQPTPSPEAGSRSNEAEPRPKEGAQAIEAKLGANLSAEDPAPHEMGEDLIHLDTLGPLKMRSCAACVAWLESGFKRTAFAGERELARRHHALLSRVEGESKAKDERIAVLEGLVRDLERLGLKACDALDMNSPYSNVRIELRGFIEEARASAALRSERGGGG